LTLEHPQFRVHEIHAHSRKLRRGALAANRFRIRVRELDTDAPALDQRVARIARCGVPNYFGPQRFGRAVGNLARVQEWLATSALPRSRSERSFTISAARSLVFNALLAERVSDGSWEMLRVGDIANLDGTGSIFSVGALTPEITERCRALDVHPSGPLWGAGTLRSEAKARELETEVGQRFKAVTSALERCGLDQERRPLRLRVAGLTAQVEGNVLTLEFRLTAGAFATAVLRELLPGTEEG
jgi:tRNA pseudouridine13 synthase